MDWRDQLDRKNPETTRIRVAVSACSETDVLSRVLEMLVEKKSTNDTNEMVIAVVDEKERPRAWILCLPWTPATTTSETSNKRTAWLRAPMSEMKVKATIFRRRERRSSVRMTESMETFGVLPVLEARLSRRVFSLVPFRRPWMPLCDGLRSTIRCPEVS